MRVVVCYAETFLREALECALANDGGYEVLPGVPSAVAAVSACRTHDAKVLIAVWESLNQEDIETLKTFREVTDSRLVVIGGSSDVADRACVSYDRFVPRSETTEGLFRQLDELETAEDILLRRVSERRASYGDPNP